MITRMTHSTVYVLSQESAFDFYTNKLGFKIADEAYFSKFHFIKQFKSIYHQTPHQYLISRRIEKARELLTAGSPVSDVCYTVGFESLPSFSGLFKRVTGMTPSAYLAQQQGRRAQIAAKPLTFIPGCFAHANGWIKK